MISAIFSDVHGNLPALETFISSTIDQVDAYVCLGDVVNYGPWNNDCLELICTLPGIQFLEGNHERLFLGIDSVDEEIALVRDFYEFSSKSYSRRDLISNLPPTCQLGPFTCAHTIGESEKIYPESQIEIDKNYLIGHSHHQFRIQRAGKEIVNCGSVGQNRGWIDSINYALLDSSNHEITLCEGPYPFDDLIKEMEHQRYSQRCIDYYLGKPRKYL